ncbi:hypothetical protein EON80_20195, partial [bacterium]
MAVFAADGAHEDGAKAAPNGLFQPPIAGDNGSLPESDIIGSTWKTDPDPALKAFVKWVGTYLTTDAATRLALEEEGVKLALLRKEALHQQIKTDPRRALANTIPFAVRYQLPTEIVIHLEKRIDAFANWGTQCSMSEKESKEEEIAEVGQQKYHAFHYGSREGARFVEGGSLHGIAIGDDLAVLNSPLRALEPGEQPKGKTIDFSKIDKLSPSSSNAANEQPDEFQSRGAQVFSGTKITVVPRPKNYQIGGKFFGKASTESQAERVASNIVHRQNNYREVASALLSDGGWVVSDTPQYLGDSGTPGSSGVQGRPPLSHTTGNKRILVTRCQSPAYPLAADLLNNNFMTNRGLDFNARYQYQSNGQLSLTFDYTPVYNLSSAFDNNNVDAKRDECVARAQSEGFNISSYDVILTVHGNVDVGWAGVQSGPKIFMKNNFEAWCFMHEFGHWLSLPHARQWVSNDGNPMSPTRTSVEYGDWMCYMGNGTNGYAYRMFNPAYLNRLRWSPDADVQTVTRSGIYTVYQYDNNVLGRIRSLKVPRDEQYTYWLSILGRAETGGVNHVNGVAIRAQNAINGNDTWLVDMSSNGGPATAPLALNAEWSDTAANLTFKVVEVGGTDPNRYAKVQITFGAANTIAYRPLVHNGIYRFTNRANSAISIAGPTSTATNQPLVMATSNDA